jgi:predicted phosphohydrolase
MNNFIEDNKIEKVKFLHNNCYEVENYIICGTRYWSYDEETEDNGKVFNREIERAKISLESAKKISEDKEIIFVSHFPPDNLLIDCVKKYNVKYWIYGHIHSNYEEKIVKLEEIETFLTSGDYLNFELLKIC